MSKYGYNENEHVKTIAEAVDKDGFHKVVEINNDEEGSSDTSTKEPIEFYIGDPDDGVASVAIIVNELYANEAGMDTTFLSSQYRKIKYYFGDEEPTYENMEEAPNDIFKMWYHSDFIDEDPAPVIYHKIILQFDANVPPSDTTTYATVIFYDVSGETPIEWGRKTSRWT